MLVFPLLEVGLISQELVVVATSPEEKVSSLEPAVVEISPVEVERPLVPMVVEISPMEVERPSVLAVVEISTVGVERPLVLVVEVISSAAEVMPLALVGEATSWVVVVRPPVLVEEVILLEAVESSLVLLVVVKQQGPEEKESSQVVVKQLLLAEETISQVLQAGRRQLEVVPEAVEHHVMPVARSLAVTSRVQVALECIRPPAVNEGSASAWVQVQAPAKVLEAVLATHPAVYAGLAWAQVQQASLAPKAASLAPTTMVALRVWGSQRTRACCSRRGARARERTAARSSAPGAARRGSCPCRRS